ncbi:MAG: hypothetical protein U1F43_09980 [Myxococcota bacterium]
MTAIDAGELRAEREGGELVVRAPWVAGDQVVSVHADGCAPVSATLHVRAMVATGTTWEVGAGPAEREHAIFWIDPGTPDALVVASGYLFEPVQLTPVWDLWSWDLAQGGWTQLEAERSPEKQSGLSGRVAARDEGGGFFLQGGEGPAADLADKIVAWTGHRWVTVGAGGPPLELHAFWRAGDDGPWLATLGLRVSSSGFTFERDVWRFDPVAGWSTLPLSDGNRPSGRYGFAYAWDAPARRLVAVSGARQPTGSDPVNAAPDTWALEVEGPSADPTGAHWVDLAPSGETPRARNGCWAYDPDGRRLLVFGGTADQATAVPGLHVLELDTGRERWVHVVDRAGLPPARASCSAAWDAARSQMVLGFGNSDAGIFRDLWTLTF